MSDDRRLITEVMVSRAILEERPSDEVPEGKDWFVIRNEVVSKRSWVTTATERRLLEEGSP